MRTSFFNTTKRDGLPRSEAAAETAEAAGQDGRADRIFIVALFCAALVANFFITTRNWDSGFLIGHEFRQTQTAIIARYIDEQNNFSLRYETPLLGKPWEFPLEMPIYQWTVVLLSRATGWTHVEAARAVSLGSVYLTLPALYLLLGHVGLGKRRRLIVLAVALAVPVYLFYGRAFLMDTMAMMFSAWFLAGFVETMRRRSLSWLVVCSIAGAAAGLVKSLTFFVWLFPAACYGAWCVWKNLRDQDGWGALARTVAWGFGAVLVPAIAVNWWVRFTDAIKETHPSAYIFTSKALTQGNFGMYDLSSRTSKETWHWLFECWSMAVAQPWVLGVIVLGGAVAFRVERWRILGAAGLFLAAQMMFPYAYAYQDYYFMACAMFAACALGFVLNGVFSLRWPRWARWPLMLVPFAALYAAYADEYYQQHKFNSPGGTGLTIALRDYLPRESVLIVAGSDWAGIIPYYSKKRALMIRNGLEVDAAYLERAFNDLSDEMVGALVLTGNQRENRALVERAAAKFHLDLAPTFSHPTGDVYVNKLYRPMVVERLQIPPLPANVTSDAKQEDDRFSGERPVAVTPGQGRAMFSFMRPSPWKFRMNKGYGLWEIDGQRVLNAHPETDLWVRPPEGAREVMCEFAIRREAYEGPHRTNGVEFSVDLEALDGTTRQVFKRYLDPAAKEEDRGLQREVFPIEPQRGESLVFRTRGPGSEAFDWSYWSRIEVR
jgi:hypothetical protein